jgi:signal transduction histidine kinase
MKLQLKILILLSSIFGVIILSFLSYQYIRIQEKQLYNLETRKNQELVIDKVLQLNRVKYEQLINDNSGWDDMITFVANPDTEWAKSNVDFFVSQFKLSFLLAYNKEKKLVYQFGDSICLGGLKYPDQALIDSDFASSPFSHYFQFCGNDLIEMFGATVVPASDADSRKTQPQGYLFTGRRWGNEYLSEHADATGYQVIILNNSELPNLKKDPSKIYFLKNLNDSSGNTLATLVFSRPDLLKQDLSPFLNLSILLTLIAFLAMIIFLFAFRYIILVPLSKISTALNTHNADHIVSLKQHTDEFKVLGALIHQVFLQEDVLNKNNTELVEINKTKDKLFSIIAHDLKNPVGNILSITELLTSYLDSKDTETCVEMIQLLRHQAQETLTLLETLLDWARSQSGHIVFQPTLLDLNPVVENVLGHLNSSALLKEIVILPPDVNHVKVFADVNLLTTILRNLITNSIKYTKAGGTICVSARMNAIETEISIVDTGIGMDRKTQEMLFKIESNLTTVGTAKEKGTGLGLIICKEFIEKHGGQIRVFSEIGKGSQFILTLPFNKRI